VSESNAPLLIGLDLGTTALKCAAYTESGDLVASATREYSLLTPADAVVEVHPSTYWSEFAATVHDLLAEPGVDAARVVALGISAQGETLLPVRVDGAPARNAIVWLDGRATDESAELTERFDEQRFYEITGQPCMLPTWPAAKILWLARHEPRVFEQTARFLLIEDYFLWRLTGEYVSEGSLLTSTCYWDFRTKRWWPEMLDVLGIDESRLPAIVEPGVAVGTLLPAAARELGLPSSMVVCTGALDQACGAIGVGTVGPGRFSENTGAAVALCATLSEARLDPERRMPCHYHGVPDTYMFHTFTSGGVVLRWFRDQFAEAEHAVAASLGLDAYDLLSQEAGTIAAGAEGLVLIPHLQGAMAPESNPNARGAVVGLSLRHGRAHVARAILESIACVVRRNVEVLEDLGVAVPEIRALGGGARSPLWKQIEADVTKRPVLTTRQPDAATLGAAILAGVGEGRFASAQEAAETMVQIDQTFEPRAGLGARYDEVYATYLQTYDALCPVFDALADGRS
jgi:xylulokinase